MRYEMSTNSSIRNEDLLALQSYVTATDRIQYDHLDANTLLLDLTHSNLKQQHIEIRFDRHDTIAALRHKVYQKTGTPPHFQHLVFYPSRGISTSSSPLFEIQPDRENDRMLGYYSLSHGTVVHCVDVDPYSASRGGAYEDTSLVEKYVMSDEEYNKRKGTLRDWERQQKQADPNFTYAKYARERRELLDAQRLAKLGLPLPHGFEVNASGTVIRVEEEQASQDMDHHPSQPMQQQQHEEENSEYNQDSVKGIEVGMRCQVTVGRRRGRIAYVGDVPEISGGGYWCGVVFDEPVGKSDGSVNGGKRYFETPGPNYGGFLRAKNLQVGDFPERNILDDDDEEEGFEDEL